MTRKALIDQVALALVLRPFDVNDPDPAGHLLEHALRQLQTGQLGEAELDGEAADGETHRYHLEELAGARIGAARKQETYDV